MNLSTLGHRIVTFYDFLMKQKRYRNITLSFVSFFVLLIIISLVKKDNAYEQRTFALVERGPLQVELIESGNVKAVSQIDIKAPMMWGEKLQVVDLVDEGTEVQEGDFLLQFDVSDLLTSQSLAEDRVTSLEADLEKLKAQQGLTIRNMENNLKLTQYSYEQAKLRVEMRQFESAARQEEAKLQLKQSEIELKKMQTQMDAQKIIHKSQIIQREASIREAKNRLTSIRDSIKKLTLTAPANGIVVYQQIRGERVKNGYEPRPGWPLMAIPDLSRMQIMVYVNEVDRLKIRVNQRAWITLDAFPELHMEGQIREVDRLAQVIDGEDRLKGFATYIDVEGSDPRLKPGLTAQVHILLDELSDVTYAPLGAVFEKEGQPVVFPKGKSRPVDVTLGARNDAFVEIKSGVGPGTRLLWADPKMKASPLGKSEELSRIASMKNTLMRSFDVFKERGILFDYLNVQDTPADSIADSPVDLQQLPPSIRQRLNQLKSSTPKVEVGETSEKRAGTFKVTPDMKKRLDNLKKKNQ